jgi:hypothetical protein
MIVWMPFFPKLTIPCFSPSQLPSQLYIFCWRATAPALFTENRQGGQFDSFARRRLATTTTTGTGTGGYNYAITAPFAA